ncbi:RNA-binding S4 domain [Cinara cedri]|uniref:RNA-binding S4 domain n=1 Tax=Cinara cedri TaxID=506608 RepID=A0A5E4LYI7_9HEMI|nr:RNA-binding S4 domain [Cinara cedri]
MFNSSRFLSKLLPTPFKLIQPISLVLCKALNNRSVWSICSRYPQSVHSNKFESLNLNNRYKRTKKDDDDLDNELDLEMDDSSKLITFRTSTLRMDAVLKHALGKSRNKIEVAFYNSQIRVNGKKISKKSHTLEVGDEVDLVKGPSPNNPDFLIVSRVEVISTKLDGDELEVKLKKFKSLLVDNYENTWKSSS